MNRRPGWWGSWVKHDTCFSFKCVKILAHSSLSLGKIFMSDAVLSKKELPSPSLKKQKPSSSQDEIPPRRESIEHTWTKLSTESLCIPLGANQPKTSREVDPSLLNPINHPVIISVHRAEHQRPRVCTSTRRMYSKPA